MSQSQSSTRASTDWLVLDYWLDWPYWYGTGSLSLCFNFQVLTRLFTVLAVSETIESLR